VNFVSGVCNVGFGDFGCEICGLQSESGVTPDLHGMELESENGMDIICVRCRGIALAWERVSGNPEVTIVHVPLLHHFP
jgi:hypothetical protein